MRYSLFALLLLASVLHAAPLQWYSVPASQGGASVDAAHSIPALAAEPSGRSDPAQLGSRLSQDVALIDDVARHYALDPLLMHAIVAIESAHKAEAVSSKGAVGLMQVMPATGARFGKRALFEPRANLEAGAAYLSWLMQHFDGRLDLVLAGYNAGEGAVERYGNTIPPYAETQAYVRKVLAHYASLRGGNGALTPDHSTSSYGSSVGKRAFVPHDSAVRVGDVGQLWRLFSGGTSGLNHQSRI